VEPIGRSVKSAKSAVEKVTAIRNVKLMAKRNTRDGYCSVCRAAVRAHEGLVEAADFAIGYRVLCPEHMPMGALDPPKPPDAAKLPSIHLDEKRYER
jgi:hypothetical protein